MGFVFKFTAQKLVLRREPIPPGAVRPEFIQRLQDVEIVEGSAAKFDVRVKGTLLFIYFFIMNIILVPTGTYCLVVFI